MAILHNDGKRRTRRPSLKGVVSMQVRNGQEIMTAWPATRKKKINPKTAEQMEWFRQAQAATKYLAPDMLFNAIEATKGTPLLPRDVLTMMFAGRLVAITMPDGKTKYSRAAMNDVSTSLDTISQTPGDTLVRGPNGWEGAPPAPSLGPAVTLRYNGVTDTIGGSFNVASVTKHGTGDYSVNFATALPSANYAVLLTGTFGGEPRLMGINIDNPVHTVNAVRIYCVNMANNLRDCTDVNVVIFNQ